MNKSNALPIISASSMEEKEWVAEQLMEFNREFLSIPRNEYIIPLNFHIKNVDNLIVAGVNAFLIARSTAYIGILWVDQDLRGQDYGSCLLQHVEYEAKKSGAAMIYLDTLDFQARGFYLKWGYEEFACLENSPVSGRKRFYMRKIL